MSCRLPAGEEETVFLCCASRLARFSALRAARDPSEAPLIFTATNQIMYPTFSWLVELRQLLNYPDYN